jgi:putative transposase
VKKRFDRQNKDEVLDFVDHMKDLTQTPTHVLISRLGMNRATYYNWLTRREMGRLDDLKPVGRNPDTLLAWGRQAIIDYYQQQRDRYSGYARLCYEMIDADIVCTSPSTVYRVLSKAGLLMRWAPAKELGNRPALPDAPNQKWHTDLMQLNYQGHVYYYQGVIDAFSRAIIAHDVHTEASALSTSLVLQAAFDQAPKGVKPVIVSDNGPEFIGKEFREVIRENNGQRMRISAYHLQSNGIDERHHRSLREECLYGQSPENLLEIKRLVDEWVGYYNHKRLHSVIWCMPPVIWHREKHHELRQVRKTKLQKAKEERRSINQKTLNQVEYFTGVRSNFD